MAQPSGLSAQIGMTKESTYGTPVTPATFFPFLSESIDIDQDIIVSDAIYAGRLVDVSAAVTVGNVKVGGDVGLELYDSGVGKLFEQMLGSNTTTGAGPYTHTLRPGTLPSATWQIGRPANDGTVYPVNLIGAKVASWEIGVKVGEYATLGLTLICQYGTIGTRTASDGVTTNSSTTVTSASGASFAQADVGKLITGTNIPSGTIITAVASATSATISQAASGSGSGITFTIGSALQSASYASSQYPLRAGKVAFTIGGSEMYPSEVTFKGDNGLTDDRRYLGSDWIREPLPGDRRSYAADFKCEFDGLTSFQAFRNGTEAALSCVLTSPASSTYSVTLSGNARYDKASTAVGGRGILEKDCTARLVASTSNDYSAFQAVIVNGDSTL